MRDYIGASGPHAIIYLAAMLVLLSAFLLTHVLISASPSTAPLARGRRRRRCTPSCCQRCFRRSTDPRSASLRTARFASIHACRSRRSLSLSLPVLLHAPSHRPDGLGQDVHNDGRRRRGARPGAPHGRAAVFADNRTHGVGYKRGVYVYDLGVWRKLQLCRDTKIPFMAQVSV